LLHGVTGSGKTEVYLHSIRAALEAGRTAIVLVPEISLTPQTVGRFKARFGDQLALLHSSLSAGERFDEWERIRRGQARIIVGARSAVFAPCRNVGVIVIDEEHERAYKQDVEPRYSALAVAHRRAAAEGAVLILGSATPSLESFFDARSTEHPLELVELPARIDSRPLPPIELVDLREQPLDGHGGAFSEPLAQELRACIDRGEQAILFLNRRGFSTFVMCRDCGLSLRCPDCDVALIYHHNTRLAVCHHCGFERIVPDLCEGCGGYDIGYRGLGTERVADQLEREVEGARVLRMDRDTTTRRGAYHDILRRFSRGEANVLVGTQMIAKGHDFPEVTLVGVLNADTGLNRPDFRASEQTFQVITQVAGRAGRADKPGRVIVQTYNPQHPAIAAASRHDYLEFYSHELAARRENRYPPFTRLIKISVADPEEALALRVAERVAHAVRSRAEGSIEVFGPVEAPLHKLRGQYRYHMVVKADDAREGRELVRGALQDVGDTGETRVTVDVDPLDMM
jgi:primosomal protein N' (replication factor Y)